MSGPLLISHRLANQRITGAKLERPEETVRWMGALQAQDYAQAVWAVGLRTRGGALANVERAIAERKIVRTWPLRGTLHFVAAEDAGWMLRLSAARRIAADRRRREQLDLSDETIVRSAQLFAGALADGQILTRAAMLDLLERAGIRTEGQRGYHILWHAAQNGVICMGPLDGKQQTFVSLTAWAPGGRALTREEGLAELAERYFTGHGPATLQDFIWWSGLSPDDARAGLAAAGARLESLQVDGAAHWQSAGAQPLAFDPGEVRLLPGFDEYLIGYTGRSVVLAKEFAGRVVPGGNGVFRPMLVIGGRVCGTWQRSLKKQGVEIVVSPFEPVKIDRESLAVAAQAYADFRGMPLSRLVVESIEA